MRLQVILDSSFARPGLAPIWGGKKGEFRDWTNPNKMAPKTMIRPIGFALSTLSFLIGSKNSRHFFIQSEVKPKPTVTRSHTFSRASLQLHVISSSFDWLAVLFMAFVIGRSDYFGFGFATLKNPPYIPHYRE